MSEIDLNSTLVAFVMLVFPALVGIAIVVDIIVRHCKEVKRLNKMSEREIEEEMINKMLEETLNLERKYYSKNKKV